VQQFRFELVLEHAGATRSHCPQVRPPQKSSPRALHHAQFADALVQPQFVQAMIEVEKLAGRTRATARTWRGSC
jgi:hypothetical protein